MASANRTKAQRKGAPGSAGRAPAWSGARASPTFSPSSPRSNQTSFPPLAQQNGTNRLDNAQDRVLQSLSGLTGTTITLMTKTSLRYEGVVALTSNEGDTTGVTLKDVKELTNPGASLKDQLFIASTNIESWSSGPADAKLTNGDTFRTDADIGQKKAGGGEKELQAWQAPPDAPPSSEALQLARGDDVTFGPGSNGSTNWDQFAVNEKLFGVKATYDEDVYTTKLDRNHPEYRERAREAQKIADEILGATANNSHVAEERNQANDDSGINEEDKYGAVVRGTNAYVPPGARKAAAVAAVTVVSNNTAKSDIPKVAVNGPDGSTVSAQSKSPASSSKAPSPAPNKPADALPALREFVANEKQRLTEKRQALAKSEMDKRMADLVKFSQSFKLNKPIPDDLVPILAKDEEKQKQIRDKSTQDAASSQARNIGVAATAQVVPARGPHLTTAKVVEAVRKPTAPAPASGKNATQASGASASAQKPKTDSSKPAKPAMFIQSIPPFKGKRQSLQPTPASNGASNNTSSASVQPPATAKTPPNTTSTSAANAAANAAAAAAAAKLNANAISFRPNPKASAFTPGAPSPGPSTSNNSISSSASPKPKDPGPTTPNPFFGTRPIKKSPPVNVKDDFNPFKHNKFADPSSINALWPYNGKRYAQMFPAPQHPPQPPHMVAPPTTMPPPPPYEEDPNQPRTAAPGGYVYYAPTYYPGQPMMPGMPPTGPPGTFMPPYMQPMHYPPGMPPNAMYAPPGMGQMPPYMPPPGTYPPPPNGAGPRPSMPPTPIPAHAHPYYHQSPQLQHAVPYPMMMPPPPGSVPGHPYDGSAAPPVQMGGHA
jgi:PAB1-binding protein PBP1